MRAAVLSPPPPAAMLQQSRSALEKPPHSSWKLGPGKVYSCFLSHYKQEAGMEARYLRDLLQKRSSSMYDAIGGGDDEAHEGALPVPVRVLGGDVALPWHAGAVPAAPEDDEMPEGDDEMLEVARRVVSTNELEQAESRAFSDLSDAACTPRLRV